MKAYILEKHGKPHVLKMKESTIPDPGPGEMRIKVRYIGLNYAEIQSRRGLYQWAPKLPYILGMEAFGIIDAVGSGVDHKRVGDKIVTGMKYGAYAEYIVVQEALVLSPLTYLTDEQNAAFPVNYMTAWIALTKMARLRKDDTVLINAAAGGVGTAAVQIAKSFNCKVIGGVGSSSKFELLEKLNVDEMIDYSNKNFKKSILERTDGKGVDVLVEVVGGDVYKQSIESLKPFGRAVVAGFAGLNLKKWNPISWVNTLKDIPRVKVRSLAINSTGVLASHIGYLLSKPNFMQDVWQELVEYCTSNNIKPVIGHQYNFSEMVIAHQLMESRRSTGKIIVKLD
jgi:NADPH2:quinone reductase